MPNASWSDDPLAREPVPSADGPARAYPYLDGLNAAQRAAVETLDGPVLVLAGAGTGKTRVLTARLAHILMTRRAWPSQILAVTFTNKAAREMRDRVASLVGIPTEGWWMGTFHALAARILRRHAEEVGLKPNFTILDTDDQLRLVKQLLEAEAVDAKRWPARLVLGVFERWKDKGLTPDRLRPEDGGEVAGGRVVALYRAYQERLRTLNACDFGDLLLHNLTLFQKVEEIDGRRRYPILEEYQQRFRYILVDEYQDTNVSQYLWLRALAQAHKNICCVGDDDQCLVAGSLVTMADRTEKPIESVQPGDLVLSSHGGGVFRPARVTDVFRRPVKRQLVRMRTASGRTLVSTPEHNHFADVILNESPQRYFTYLMMKRGYGYRVGTSQVYTRGQRHPVIGYQLHCVQERGDAVWLVRAFEHESDAREFEHRLSLKYGITTFPFVARKGSAENGLVHDQSRLNRLHRDLAGSARVVELMEDFGLDPAHPHHVPQSVPGRRRNLILTLNAEHRGATPMHRIALSGNDEDGLEHLTALGLGPRCYKRNPNNWRYETVFREFGRLEAIKSQLVSRFDLTMVRKADILGKVMTIRPAGQIVPGMVVPLLEGRHDVVVAVDRIEGGGEVFDLNVEGSHNFVANGIVTHNSIYSWRGAEVANILRFEQEFPGAAVIRLEQNYRSTDHILAAASGLIAHNQGRLGKTLFTQAPGGEKVVLHNAHDSDEEARWIGDEVERLQREGVRLDEIAVLVRASFQMRWIEERFLTLGLPYRVVGGPRFYERLEIRDALAYLRVVAQPDDDLAFERIVNTPKRGIGPSTLQLLHQLARAASIPLAEATWRLTGTDELKPRVRGVLRTLMQDFERWRELAAKLPHPELAQIVLDESGYTGFWQQDKSPEAAGRLENLKELIAAMEEFETLGGFLEHVSLVSENEANQTGEQVTLMTLHAAKGLEFEHVFLPGWEEGLFPHQRAMDESGIAGLEEERRLAYVGLTRAKRRAYISTASRRQVHGIWQDSLPSRFAAELPASHVDVSSDVVFGGDHGDYRPSFTFQTPRFGGFMRKGPTTIEGTAYAVDERSRPDRPFVAGDRVFHQKFGYGTVRAADNDKLTIAFDHSGEKKVMDSFVVPADQAG